MPFAGGALRQSQNKIEIVGSVTPRSETVDKFDGCSYITMAGKG